MQRELEEALGLNEALAIESSEVTVRIDKRRYGKNVTVLAGFDADVDVKALTKDLKQHLGTGGTARDHTIELQGDHRRQAADYLRKQGFPVE